MSLAFPKFVMKLATALAVSSCSAPAKTAPDDNAVSSAYERQDVLTLTALANQGNAEAQFKLGFMYNAGKGVPNDDDAAIIWYRKAADQGYAQAQFYLGSMYRFGTGVVEDNAAAINWYKKAAEQGNSKAQEQLGWMYSKGTGVVQDYSAAASWYRKAAEQGNSQAQNYLGWMYADGTGVAQDYVQAHMWFNLSAAGATEANLRDGATINRDRLAAKMTPAQIAEAQKLASAFKVK